MSKFRSKKNVRMLTKKTLAVILAGVFLFTSTLCWAKEEKLFLTGMRNNASSSGPADNSMLSPESRLKSQEFKISLTVAAICKHIEHDGNLGDTSHLKDVLGRLDAEKNPNITVLPDEIMIEIPNEGLAIRYFDPTKANIITPYSDISRLSTKVIGPKLNRQIIHRIRALSDAAPVIIYSNSKISRDKLRGFYAKKVSVSIIKDVVDEERDKYRLFLKDIFMPIVKKEILPYVDLSPDMHVTKLKLRAKVSAAYGAIKRWRIRRTMKHKLMSAAGQLDIAMLPLLDKLFKIPGKGDIGQASDIIKQLNDGFFAKHGLYLDVLFTVSETALCEWECSVDEVIDAISYNAPGGKESRIYLTDYISGDTEMRRQRVGTSKIFGTTIYLDDTINHINELYDTIISVNTEDEDDADPTSILFRKQWGNNIRHSYYGKKMDMFELWYDELQTTVVEETRHAFNEISHQLTGRYANHVDNELSAHLATLALGPIPYYSLAWTITAFEEIGKGAQKEAAKRTLHAMLKGIGYKLSDLSMGEMAQKFASIDESRLRDIAREAYKRNFGEEVDKVTLTRVQKTDKPSNTGVSSRIDLRYHNYVDQNRPFVMDILGESKPDILLRVPMEAIESIGMYNIKDFRAILQKAPNAYLELFYMSGTGEVSESVYQKYGLQKKALPKDFKRTRENTVTLFPALKGEDINQSAIVLRIGTVTPQDTILSPIGLQHDPAGLIRATILGLKMIDIARQIKEKGIGTTKDQAFKDKIQLEILEQLKNVCDTDDLKNFNLTPDDIISLAAGTINNIIIALKKLIKLLPITPINAEELRQIYEHAKEVITAA